MDVLRLVELGLTENEARVYVALVELGESPASAVARKARVNRSVAYSTLESLLGKGLCSFVIKGGVKVFVPSPPERLLSWLQEKAGLAGIIVAELHKRELPRSGVRAEVLLGWRGVYSAVDRMVTVSKEWCSIGWTGEMKHLQPAWFSVLEKRRVGKGCLRRIICTRDKKRLLSGMKLVRARFVPKEYVTPASIAFSGDLLALVIPYEVEPVTLLFENRDMVQAYRKYFALLWRVAKP
mgnify:FL=1